jgi:cell division protein FtsI (penicillin-binding protein 3)
MIRSPGPPPTQTPETASGARTAPAPARGAPRDGAVPRFETVRVTAPDLKRRAAIEKTRSRLVFAAAGFGLLFLAVIAKLADATILQPVAPHRPEKPIAELVEGPRGKDPGVPVPRATITDRNGEILAISLPTAALYANPREMIDPADTAHRLKQALPRLDEPQMLTRLSEAKQFVYLARQLTPREQLAINRLGIPGVYFEPTDRRRYPMGRTAAQILGGVDVDGHGVAGVERSFEDRLRTDQTPLRLSIDVRVQAVVRDELLKAKEEFGAIGACGIVMDVRTGELLAMVSLPDYDANNVGTAPSDDRFNRAVTGMYEPGSTFKLQTAAMALDSGIANIWNEYDASHNIHIGRFTITDFEGKHRWLFLPEVLAYSSNLGAAHIAQSVGADKQRSWLRSMGMFSRTGVELPEAGVPIIPAAANWKEVVTLTVGFGHGIAVSPLHVVRGTAAIANGGILMKPTILGLAPDAPPPEGVRIMQQTTSDTLRKLMRLVVTDGYGKTAEVPGYYPGGKTGTAEKVGAHGYKKHANVAAFMSVFPMNAPRYAVYMMLDEPHATAATHGYATAGWVAAPAAGRVIGRIGPMLGMLPDLDHAAEIQQALYIPLRPARPVGSHTPIAQSAPHFGTPTGVPSVRDAKASTNTAQAAAPRPGAAPAAAPASATAPGASQSQEARRQTLVPVTGAPASVPQVAVR